MKIYVDASPKTLGASFTTDYVVYLIVEDRRALLKSWSRPNTYDTPTNRERVENYVTDVANLLNCEITWSDEELCILM